MFATASVRSILALLVGLALFATACSGSSPVDIDDSAADVESPTAVAPVDDEPVEDAPEEPTAVQPEPEPEPEEPTVEPEPASTPIPEPTGPAPDFRADNLLGISNDGQFAYAGSTNPFNGPSDCGGEPFQALAAIDTEQAASAEAVVFGPGFEQAGDVVQLAFGDDGAAAVLSSCGDQEESWVQQIRFDGAGRIVDIGPVLDLEVDETGRFANLVSASPGELVIEVVIEFEPDDFESWVIETRTIDAVSGEVTGVEERPFFDGSGFRSGVDYVSPDGQFTYRQVDDPTGRLGCEGAFPAATIEVDDGSGPRLALGPDGVVFSELSNMHFGPDGLVAWTSGCEGFTSAYVGRVLEDGSIVDAHFVSDIDQVDTDVFVDLRYFRLADDGTLVGIGALFDASTDPEVVVTRYDLSADPQFVETADPRPQIDDEPLGDMMTAAGSWFVGDTTSSEPACGAQTLYGSTSSGFVRAFFSGFEIDAIVDLDVSETQVLTFDNGFGGQDSFSRRTIVLSTECPGEYEGVRIWFGDEAEDVHYGTFVGRADAPEVAEVLSVRDVLGPDSNFPDSVVAEVELLDGTITELELELVLNP